MENIPKAFLIPTSDTNIACSFFNPGSEEVPIVMLHGLGEGSYVWKEFVVSLGENRPTVLIDLRGHGQSSWSERGDYSFSSYASDIEKVLRYIGIKKCILIGHSLGGRIGLQLAVDAPEVITALILADSGPCEDNDIKNYLKSDLLMSYRPYSNIDEYYQFLLGKRRLTDSERLRCLAEDALMHSTEGYRLKFDVRAIKYEDASDNSAWWFSNLSKLKIDSLLLRGAGSALLSKQVAIRMTNACSHLRFMTIKHAGHSIMSDNPSEFCAHAIPFISEWCV